MHPTVTSLIFAFLFFSPLWSHHAACGMLAPQPGTEPGPSAVKVRSPNHWTAREFPLHPSSEESSVSAYSRSNVPVTSFFLMLHQQIIQDIDVL